MRQTLFPIHCPETPEHVEGHWTLLSLERKGHESHVTVRYFETLDAMNEVCEARANKLLQICEVQESVSRRCNCFKQAGNDCVWWVLHYAEVEARMEHGEGLGACLSMGHGLRKLQIKHTLKLASQQLETTRSKWLQDEKTTGPD